MLVAGVMRCQDVRALHAHTEKARGIVVGMAADATRRVQSPVIEFRKRDGQLVRFTSRLSYTPPAYRHGEAVEVMYRISDASQAEIASGPGQWFGPAFISGIGLALCLNSGIALIGMALGRRLRFTAPD